MNFPRCDSILPAIAGTFGYNFGYFCVQLRIFLPGTTYQTYLDFLNFDFSFYFRLKWLVHGFTWASSGATVSRGEYISFIGTERETWISGYRYSSSLSAPSVSGRANFKPIELRGKVLACSTILWTSRTNIDRWIIQKETFRVCAQDVMRKSFWKIDLESLDSNPDNRSRPPIHEV